MANYLAPYFQRKVKEIDSHRAVAKARGFSLIAPLELVPREGREAFTPRAMLELMGWSLIRDADLIGGRS